MDLAICFCAGMAGVLGFYAKQLNLVETLIPVTLFLFHSFALLVSAEKLRGAQDNFTANLWAKRFHTLLYTVMVSSACLIQEYLCPSEGNCSLYPLRLPYHRLWCVLWILDVVLLTAICRVLDWSFWTLCQEWRREVNKMISFVCNLFR